MKLIGEIDIFGAVRFATVGIKDRKGKGVTYIPGLGEKGKYKAYGYADGKIKYYGYYDTEREAEEAALLQRNLAREKKLNGKKAAKPRKDAGTGVTYVGSGWRVQLSIGGVRVSLGRYGTYGNAVLVRDVVARRTGRHVIVEDYSMPLALVTDAVARSYITDRILPATPDELAEYQRRVDELNRSVGGHTSATVTVPQVATLATLATLPPEEWRQKQPSRTGHATRAGRSPFDSLED
ncbi:hypothetical protein [Ensifer aridi]|uniref:hypothetical protein n=1 Tax=Ensifer aridi TaxID=1708715 RepID=UPI000A0FF134|nr:hypothetical protein [Ensifer aridi]